MSIKSFRFRLKIGADDYQESNPRWGNDVAFVTEGQTDEMFFRETLTVKLTYQRTDFDSIYAADFETEFRALLQQEIAGFWTDVWEGKFWYNDIDFDVDNRTCICSPETFDLYDDFLAGLEKEFDLIALEPPTVTVSMLKQAVIQVYLPGASFVANYTNDGIFYETPCTPFATTPEPGDAYDTTNHLTLINDSGFGLGTGFSTPSDGLFNHVRVIIPGEGLSPDISGVYRADAYTGDGIPNGSFTREDGSYTIESFNTSPGNLTWRITDNAGATIVYESAEVPTPNFFYGQPPHTTPSLLFTSLTDPTSECYGYLFFPYVRLLTNSDEVNGNPAVLLTDSDPIPHGTFTYALPIETLNFEVSAEHDTSPTRWGKFDLDALFFGGEYFVKPASTETLMPVAGTTWTGASAWFWLDDDLRTLQQQGSESILIKDAYKLSDVIAALLAEIQPLVTHEDDAAFSNFLYAAGTNPIRGDRKVPIIIPKSNVVVGNYDQPAKKALIRMSEVRDLLQFFHNVYWHIEDETLIFEHENYYHNGKSYIAENVGTDLTTGIEPKTELAWAYRTNRFKFEKDALPERIETKWMDKGSPQFDGFPIQTVSAYAQRGNIQQRNIARFTSDIDFIHVAANDISKDGFVFLECLEGELYYEVPFVEFVISADETYNMQNGYASLIYAHYNYHRHNLPTTDVNLNKEDISAITVKRSKVQDIIFATESEIDPYELIETQLGVGRLKKMVRPITSNTAETTILHNTE